MSQHNSKTPISIRDSWSTPQYLFDYLNSIFGFDVDLCASKENAKCGNYLDEEINSLNQNWINYGEVGFCNPPYSNIKPWIEKAFYSATHSNFKTVLLIPTPNGESYYKKVLESANSIGFITGRIAFINAETNKPVSGNTRGSCIIEIGGNAYNSAPKIANIDRDVIKRIFTNET